VLIVVVPQTSYVIAVQSVDPVGAWWEQANELNDQVAKRLGSEGIAPRGRGLALEQQYAQRFEDMDA